MSPTLIELSAVLRESELQTLRRQTRLTAGILSGVHFGIVVLALWCNDPIAVKLHGFCGVLACLFGVCTYWGNRSLRMLGVMCILIGMSVFLFLYPGPRSAVTYVIAPVPAFRVLGLRWGTVATSFFLVIATSCLLFYPPAIDQLHIETRINTLIALVTATAFGYLIERENSLARRNIASILNELRALRGIVQVCAACKKIGDAAGNWHDFESFLHSKGGTEFSHGLCKDCATEWLTDANSGLE